MRAIILTILKFHNGISEVSLALRAIEVTLPNEFDSTLYHQTIQFLREDGELFDLVYFRPGKAAVGHLYFSKETTLLFGGLDARAIEDIVVRQGERNT